MTENDNQKFLKKVDKVDRTIGKFTYKAAVVLYAVITLFVAAAVVYYVICEIKGTGNPKQLAICCASLLLLAAIPVCGKLIDLLFKWFFHRDNVLDPQTMELPKQGSVGLEAALHKMSTQTGVIVWDSLWGCVLVSLLFSLLFINGNKPRILLICVCLAFIIAIGHVLFRLIWKKHSFIKKMLCNTEKFIPLASDYAREVDESLLQNILCYEKELIMTDKYILGSIEHDTKFIPVAIPIEQVKEFVFFYRRVVNGKYSRSLGILSCRISSTNSVNFMLGIPTKTQKILKILNFYNISWREDKTTYV